MVVLCLSKSYHMDNKELRGTTETELKKQEV